MLFAKCTSDESPDGPGDGDATDAADSGTGELDSAPGSDADDTSLLDGNDSDADAADAADAPIDVERVPCTSNGTECAAGERCVHTGTGYCSEFEGVCVATPTECPPNPTDWRTCPCEGLPSASLCTFRQVSGRRAGLCIEREGTACTPSNGIGCASGQVCVPRACEGGTCGGVCLALADACSDAPAGEVCAGELWLTGDPLDPLGACWPSACDAWNDAYRGILICAQ